MKSYTLLASIFTAILLTACAHPIMISPDISKIERESGARVIEQSIGYYISADREMEITTAGGGGRQGQI